MRLSRESRLILDSGLGRVDLRDADPYTNQEKTDYKDPCGVVHRRLRSLIPTLFIFRKLRPITFQ